MLEFVVRTIFSFLGLACTGTSGSVSDNSREMSVKKGMLEWLPSRVLGHIEQYNMFELLHDTSFDMNLLAFSFTVVLERPI